MILCRPNYKIYKFFKVLKRGFDPNIINIEKYYNFHDEEKEITFQRYDTPTPWMNYLSNGTFHTMISQAGGGVAFYKSPQIWRINHYRFFHLPTDRSGFYTYIKDEDSFWCPTNEPCKTKPDQWSSTHGMGYTRFEAMRNNISARTTYFVGDFENCLIWNMKLENHSDENKTLTIFPFVELGMMEFMRELQWQCYNKHQLSVYPLEDALVYHYGVEMQPKPEETPLVYFATNAKVSAYDCDRDEFVGSYRSEENPINVQMGKCTNSSLAGGDPCFAFQVDVALAPGEEKTLNFFLGTAMTEEEIKKSVAHCKEEDFVEKSFNKLKQTWTHYLDLFRCEIPDKDAERMVNIWNPYQAHRNFLFSRNISYYATGTFRGVGFRDTAQDILAIVPFDTSMAKEKVKLLLGQQYQDGHVNHYFFPNEGWDPVTRIHSDNHLWIIMAVYAIIIETGCTDFLKEVVPFYDGGEDTIYNHLKKSIEFTLNNLGERGFPLMLSSDWNDMLYKVCREGKGESIMVSMQLGVVSVQMDEMANLLGESSTYLDIFERQKELINTLAWDGEWFRRGTMDTGRYIGSKEEPQAKIWLNTQTWAVISGMADQDKAMQAMDSVHEHLDTELGIKKIHPSMDDYPNKEDPLTHYNKGCGENGSVFCHANTWAIIAECLLGRGDRAYKYYHQLLPMIAQEKAGAWRYKAEPYVYCSNLFGPESDKFGLANVSWLTGTAAWMYVAVTQFILGIKASWKGLTINPCIPSSWNGFKVTRTFRGCVYDIEVINDSKNSQGRKELWVDGKMIEGNVVPFYNGVSKSKVKVVL